MIKLKVWYKRGRLNPSKTLYTDGFTVIFYQSEGRNGNIELPGGDDGQGVGHDYEILVVVVVVVVVGRRPPESCIC